MKDKKIYWKSIQQIKGNQKNHNQNHSIIDLIKNKKISRRDFLKLMGFSTAAIILSACRGKVIYSIPYIDQPKINNTGQAVYYASTMLDSFDVSAVLVKTKDGRPIKIKKNKILNEFNISKTHPRIQASLLSLYDNDRIKNPYKNNKIINWKNLDKYVIKKLNKIKNKKTVILTSSIPSPTTKNVINKFIYKFKNTEHVICDSISYHKILNATKQIFGFRGIPFFDLSKIKLIISFNADFLSDWSQQNMMTSYIINKKPSINMLQHIQIEGNFTLTGANADIRIPLTPSKIKNTLIDLYNLLFFNTKTKNKLVHVIYKKIIQDKNKSVIFADGDEEMYLMSFLINKKLKSKAIKDKTYLTCKQSNDKILKKFIKELKNNEIGALLLYNCNPIYSIYHDIKKYIKKIELKISFSTKNDETSKICNILAPVPHWLECWGDTNPITNIYTLTQPVIEKVFNTRQFEESLLIWQNANTHDYYEYLKTFWNKNIIPYSKNMFFNKALYQGIIKTNKKIIYKNQKISNYIVNKKKSIKNNKLIELILHPSFNLGDGTQSNNPWLQELPDPITKITWDNYLSMSAYDAKKIGVKNWQNIDGSLSGSKINLHLYNNININNIPVYIQPGQAKGCVSLFLGYGKNDGSVSKQSGEINGYKLYNNFNNIQFVKNIYLSNSNHDFACTQSHYNLEGRKDIIQEIELRKFNNELNKKIINKKKHNTEDTVDLWGKKNQEIINSHHFNMSIDLNSCIGCNACIIACQVENNIPVVGKEEIKKSRDMHWIRIDRYFISQKNNINNNSIDNPNVIFQPIMCQHCEHAPCETVCPVGATTHSEQGQNMMTYNRCIGTRYCANNCPYKVRRFNWFKYSNNIKFNFNMNNDIGRMVLNPDVVVRSRGVMEKCSMCIQMTQKTIINKKKNIKNIKFSTACSQSCPTNAIIFGDINDKKSQICKEKKSARKYNLLNFLGTKPNVFYQKKIRNSK